MKIAILAFHFKPDEAVGSVRPENWAKWLAESHEVVVVTREMVCADDTEVQGYRILRPPSGITRLIDRANTWRKNRRNRGANRRAMSSRTVPEVSKSTSGAFVYRMPCLCDLWFSACYRALRRERPDVVIATHSPYISLIAAWVYATMNSRTKLWLDFRDLWTASHLASGVPFLRGIERLLEARALSRADMVSTVSQGLRESFLGKVTNGNVAVIYNSPTDAVTLGRNEKLNSSDVVVCYTGTIYNGWQDPTPLLKLLSELKESVGLTSRQAQLKVASRNPGNLLSLVARTDTQEFVDFVGAVSRKEATCMQAEADVLLLLESPSAKAKGVLTGKVFEYLATDKPILLIGPGPESELYQLLNGHGRLISLEQLAAVLTGKATLPVQTPVDSSAISRRQLLEAVSKLDR